MKKIKHFIIGITVVTVIIVNLINCSNNLKTSEIKKEVVENETYEDSERLLDLMDSMALWMLYGGVIQVEHLQGLLLIM